MKISKEKTFKVLVVLITIVSIYGEVFLFATYTDLSLLFIILSYVLAGRIFKLGSPETFMISIDVVL